MEKSQVWEKQIDENGNQKMVLVEEKDIPPLPLEETPEEKFLRLLAEAEEVKKQLDQG